ncbi:MAG: hypothetical protein Kow0031_28250 [Anaerolineae bacterium]
MTDASAGSSPVTVDHIADAYNRYPGEVVTFFTRIECAEELREANLRIGLPGNMLVGDYNAPADFSGLVPRTEVGSRQHYLLWELDRPLAANTVYEFATEAIIAPTAVDLTLESEARLTNTADELLAGGRVRVAVAAKGSYIQHLPALYQRDDFMGRFLMLFESFWKPLEAQVDTIPYYFDPRTAPTAFLPWLASWLDLELDDRWPEEQVRRLIRWAIALHRSRGTRWGLLKYLEIYTGQHAKIIEKVSNNFVIGPGAALGPNIALGRGNLPHTFTVSLKIPPLEIDDPDERKRRETIQRRTIESIIEMQKPGHTLYTLELEYAWPGEDEEPAEAEEGGEQATDEISAQAETWFKLDDE